MAQKIVVEGEISNAAELLEAGNILFFPKTPFDFPQSDIDFLLKQKQSESAARKNVAYKPAEDKLTNYVSDDPEKLKAILKNYSEKSSAFMEKLTPMYAKGWQVDYTSFRPFQEKGRKLRLRARNDLLHVDAFPTRPLNGARILRFFTNINPTESRHWITSKGFADLAAKYAYEVKIPPSPRFDWRSTFLRKWRQILRLPMRSPYDTFMLNMHNFMKENSEFQEKCLKDHWEFPPGSCWAVFTDQVSHAALSGQYALEQTFLVPQKNLVYPERAPIAILERLANRNLLDPHLR